MCLAGFETQMRSWRHVIKWWIIPLPEGLWSGQYIFVTKSWRPDKRHIKHDWKGSFKEQEVPYPNLLNHKKKKGGKERNTRFFVCHNATQISLYAYYFEIVEESHRMKNLVYFCRLLCSVSLCAMKRNMTFCNESPSCKLQPASPPSWGQIQVLSSDPMTPK